jgi:hypothetical protein
MPLKPGNGAIERGFACRNRESEPFKFLLIRCKVMVVQPEEDAGRCDSRSLVAVDEGVIARQGFHQRSCLMEYVRVEILPGEGRPGPRDRGPEKVDIENAVGSARLINDSAVDEKDLLRRKVFHFFESSFRAGRYFSINSFT